MPSNEPVIRGAFKLPVIVIPDPVTINDPVIKAVPEKGKPFPVPPTLDPVA